MAGRLVIRPVIEADRADWLELRRALWPKSEISELAAEAAEIFGDPDQPVFVAVRNRLLIGFVELSLRSSAAGCISRPIPYIEGWFVKPEHRRQGVGGLLIKAGEEWAKGRGYSEIASDTNDEFPLSPAAHRALGFVEVERLICYRKSLD